MATSPTAEGRLPMLSSEAAPSSPRPWASAWPRPLADDINVPRTLRAACQNRTFLLCLDRAIRSFRFYCGHATHAPQRVGLESATEAPQVLGIPCFKTVSHDALWCPSGVCAHS